MTTSDTQCSAALSETTDIILSTQNIMPTFRIGNKSVEVTDAPVVKLANGRTAYVHKYVNYQGKDKHAYQFCATPDTM